MGWKSSVEITRQEAINLIISNIYRLSNEELGVGLEGLGFGDNPNLPHYGSNFSITD